MTVLRVAEKVRNLSETWFSIWSSHNLLYLQCYNGSKLMWAPLHCTGCHSHRPIGSCLDCIGLHTQARQVFIPTAFPLICLRSQTGLSTRNRDSSLPILSPAGDTNSCQLGRWCRVDFARESTFLSFWFVFCEYTNTNTKYIAGQSAREDCAWEG